VVTVTSLFHQIPEQYQPQHHQQVLIVMISSR
jgi:hypothetical protein